MPLAFTEELVSADQIELCFEFCLSAATFLVDELHGRILVLVALKLYVVAYVIPNRHRRVVVSVSVFEEFYVLLSTLESTLIVFL